MTFTQLVRTRRTKNILIPCSHNDTIEICCVLVEGVINTESTVAGDNVIKCSAPVVALLHYLPHIAVKYGPLLQSLTKLESGANLPGHK